MAFFFLHVEVANYSHCQHSLQGHREVCILPRTTAVVHTALPSLPSMLPRSIWRCADIVIIYISTSSFIFTPTSSFFLYLLTCTCCSTKTFLVANMRVKKTFEQFGNPSDTSFGDDQTQSRPINIDFKQPNICFFGTDWKAGGNGNYELSMHNCCVPATSFQGRQYKLTSDNKMLNNSRV